jgi:hypothetical protein
MVSPYPAEPVFGGNNILGTAQGMFGGLRRGFSAGNRTLHPYSNRLMLAGLGMLGGGPSDAMKGLVAGSALDTEDADRRKLNKALQDLMSSESDLIPDDPAIRGLMVNDPKFAEATLLQRMKPADIGEKYQGYLSAKAEGYTGDWMQYQADTKAAGVTVNTGDYKVPTGYMPVDPNDPSKGVQKVPGVETETVTNRKASVKSAVASINDQLNRYEELVGKYGVEAVPGPAKDQLLTVRRGLQLQLKELFNLGVLNGPDLELMDSMLWDPSVGGSGAGNIPSQLYTGATGGASARAKTSAAELRRIIKSIEDSVEGKSESGNLTKNDDGTLTWSP